MKLFFKRDQLIVLILTHLFKDMENIPCCSNNNLKKILSQYRLKDIKIGDASFFLSLNNNISYFFLENYSISPNCPSFYKGFLNNKNIINRYFIFFYSFILFILESTKNQAIDWIFTRFISKEINRIFDVQPNDITIYDKKELLKGLLENCQDLKLWSENKNFEDILLIFEKYLNKAIKNLRLTSKKFSFKVIILFLEFFSFYFFKKLYFFTKRKKTLFQKKNNCLNKTFY